MRPCPRAECCTGLRRARLPKAVDNDKHSSRRSLDIGNAISTATRKVQVEKNLTLTSSSMPISSRRFNLVNTSTNVTFANETLYMAPNTFEVALSIFNWPFSSTQNTLTIVFENSFTGKSGGGCNSQSYTDSTDNLRWVVLSSGDVSVYSKLVDVFPPPHPSPSLPSLL